MNTDTGEIYLPGDLIPEGARVVPIADQAAVRLLDGEAARARRRARKAKKIARRRNRGKR